MNPTPGALFLGIDTGGTYTDAVLWSEAAGVAAKAKALTTRHDLAVGISGAVDAVLAKAGVAPASIKLVSMSTTLATNALVEGQGGRVALVMIGFSEADLARDGLKAALGTDPVLFVPGGHDVHGNAAPLDLAALEAALPRAGGKRFRLCGLRLFRRPQPGARERRPRADPRKDRAAGHRQPRAVGKARRPAPGADHAAQRPPDLHDRPARRRHRRFSAAARHRGAADGGARRRRAGVGGLRPAAADRDDPVRPGRQPGRRPPHDRPRRGHRLRHRRHHHRRRRARQRPAAARPGRRHGRRLPHHGRGGRHAHLRARRRFRSGAGGWRAGAAHPARAAPPRAAGARRLLRMAMR